MFLGKSASRAVRRPIFQDKHHSSIHLGKSLDLGSIEGVRGALEELEGVRRSLVERNKALVAGKEVLDICSESSSDESFAGFSDEDEEMEE